MRTLDNFYIKNLAQSFPTVSQSSFEAVLAANAHHGSPLPFLHVTNRGIKEQYIDDLNKGFNQSHHYVAYFYMGYNFGRAASIITNTIRDWRNPADVSLGNAGAIDGFWYHFQSDQELLEWINDIWSE
jgi:hypothetical protein